MVLLEKPITDMMEDVSVKDYVDQQFRQHNLIHIKDAEQLGIQAKEYARRLDELNHAHERAESDRHQYITVGIYEATHRNTTVYC